MPRNSVEVGGFRKGSLPDNPPVDTLFNGGHLFLKPNWQPVPDLGIQFFAWGNGGPSGNLRVKARTARPWPFMLTMDPELTALMLMQMDAGGAIPEHSLLFGMVAAPMGVPHTRPVNPLNNQFADAQNYGVIQGLMKRFGNGTTK